MKSNKIIELFEKEFGPNGNFINIHDQKKYINHYYLRIFKELKLQTKL